MAKYGSSWQLRSRDLISETCFVRHGDLPFQFAEAIQSEVADRNNSKPKVYTGEELRLRLGGLFISCRAREPEGLWANTDFGGRTHPESQIQPDMYPGLSLGLLFCFFDGVYRSL